MSKLLIRIVAVILIPCFLVDPTLVASQCPKSVHSEYPTQTQSFQEQALASTLQFGTHFSLRKAFQGRKLMNFSLRGFYSGGRGSRNPQSVVREPEGSSWKGPLFYGTVLGLVDIASKVLVSKLVLASKFFLIHLTLVHHELGRGGMLIDHVYNFLGPWGYYAFVVGLVVIALALSARHWPPWVKTFIVAAAVGNVGESALWGYVTDWIPVAGIHRVTNLADIYGAIALGTLASLVIRALSSSHQRQVTEEQAIGRESYPPSPAHSSVQNRFSLTREPSDLFLRKGFAFQTLTDQSEHLLQQRMAGRRLNTNWESYVAGLPVPKESTYRGMRLTLNSLNEILRHGLSVAESSFEVINFSPYVKDAVELAFHPLGTAPQEGFIPAIVIGDNQARAMKPGQDLPFEHISVVAIYDRQTEKFVELAELYSNYWWQMTLRRIMNKVVIFWKNSSVLRWRIWNRASGYQSVSEGNEFWLAKEISKPEATHLSNDILSVLQPSQKRKDTIAQIEKTFGGNVTGWGWRIIPLDYLETALKSLQELKEKPALYDLSQMKNIRFVPWYLALGYSTSDAFGFQEPTTSNDITVVAHWHPRLFIRDFNYKVGLATRRQPLTIEADILKRSWTLTKDDPKPIVWFFAECALIAVLVIGLAWWITGALWPNSSVEARGGLTLLGLLMGALFSYTSHGMVERVVSWHRGNPIWILDFRKSVRLLPPASLRNPEQYMANHIALEMPKIPASRSIPRAFAFLLSSLLHVTVAVLLIHLGVPIGLAVAVVILFFSGSLLLTVWRLSLLPDHDAALKKSVGARSINRIGRISQQISARLFTGFQETILWTIPLLLILPVFSPKVHENIRELPELIHEWVREEPKKDYNFTVFHATPLEPPRKGRYGQGGKGEINIQPPTIQNPKLTINKQYQEGTGHGQTIFEWPQHYSYSGEDKNGQYQIIDVIDPFQMTKKQTNSWALFHTELGVEGPWYRPELGIQTALPVSGIKLTFERANKGNVEVGLLIRRKDIINKLYSNHPLYRQITPHKPIVVALQEGGPQVVEIRIDKSEFDDARRGLSDSGISIYVSANPEYLPNSSMQFKIRSVELLTEDAGNSQPKQSPAKPAGKSKNTNGGKKTLGIAAALFGNSLLMKLMLVLLAKSHASHVAASVAFVAFPIHLHPALLALAWAALTGLALKWVHELSSSRQMEPSLSRELRMAV